MPPTAASIGTQPWHFSATPLAAPAVTASTTGGTLPTGDYTYRYTLTTTAGVLVSADAVAAVTGPSGRVVVTVPSGLGTGTLAVWRAVAPGGVGAPVSFPLASGVLVHQDTTPSAGTAGTAPAGDFFLTVLVGYGWGRPAPEVTLLEDPCGGPPTVESSFAGIVKRRGALEFHLYGGGSPARALYDALLNAFTLRGPYTVVTERETFSLLFAPSEGQWQERYLGTEIVVTCGAVEV